MAREVKKNVGEKKVLNAAWSIPYGMGMWSLAHALYGSKEPSVTKSNKLKK